MRKFFCVTTICFGKKSWISFLLEKVFFSQFFSIWEKHKRSKADNLDRNVFLRPLDSESFQISIWLRVLNRDIFYIKLFRPVSFIDTFLVQRRTWIWNWTKGFSWTILRRWNFSDVEVFLLQSSSMKKWLWWCRIVLRESVQCKIPHRCKVALFLKWGPRCNIKIASLCDFWPESWEGGLHFFLTDWLAAFFKGNSIERTFCNFSKYLWWALGLEMLTGFSFTT